MKLRLLCVGLVVALAAYTTFLPSGVGQGKDAKETGKPKYDNPAYLPTPDEVINKMFEVGKINKDDVIFDLGCGDGRILYMAAKKFGTRGVGLELNPIRIREAMDQAEKYKVGTLVEIRHGDALKPKDLQDATVVVLYMFPEFMDLWFPVAEKTLRPGTRILSHDYSWTKGWKPVVDITVKSTTRDNHKMLMWVVPEKGKKD